MPILSVNASAADIFFRRLRNVPALIDISRAHSETTIVLPQKLIMTFCRVFLFCSAYVAQRQFPLEYPRLLLILSRVHRTGLSPMSLKNAAKDLRHFRQTFIPRPPYLGQAFAFLFSQRSIMPDQELYALVLTPLCLR